MLTDEQKEQLGDLFYSISTEKGKRILTPEFCDDLVGEVEKIMGEEGVSSKMQPIVSQPGAGGEGGTLNVGVVVPGTVKTAIEIFMRFGDETLNQAHNGYYSKGGWPYEILREFIDGMGNI